MPESLFSDLESADLFSSRHIAPDADEIREMLRVVGRADLDALVEKTVPPGIRLDEVPSIPSVADETEFLKLAREVSEENQRWLSCIGTGYYGTITPPVIQRNVLENPGWYTQYTPYQAEIAQGRLEALLNFQTLVLDLTGLEITNASLLDEGTAAAEAMALFFALRADDAHKVFLASDRCHPQTLAVLRTRAEPLGIELRIASLNAGALPDGAFGMLLQYPDTYGEAGDPSALIAAAKGAGIKVALAADLLALTLLKSPGELGADIALGSSQRFGVPMGYGGPHAAFLAAKDEYKRHMPGRIIGVSVDRHGKRALRMALQTREQHIRREKATSNICTAQVLLAVMAGFYAVYHGPEGLRRIARRVHALTRLLEASLAGMGCVSRNAACFDTLHVTLPGKGASLTALRAEAEAARINFRYHADGSLGVSVDETWTLETVRRVARVFAEAVGGKLPDRPALEALARTLEDGIPASLRRAGDILTHPVFRTHHSEHEMLRYIRSLEKKDLSLTTSMIPLGSCTMKLNATAEMMPLSWPGFAEMHPFVPENQAKGYRRVFTELERDLAAITLLPGVSLQPNAGSQGEYAGLLVIRAYQKAQGQGHRDVCLIPSSAHGTNPASAAMAGMRVVVSRCDESGNIDLADLKRLAEEHKDNLCCAMITYPSTHGVFEHGIVEACALIHANGGQVYMDGANLNAQVGLTAPGRIGADVCHINLHKTFCIPHGGGGPGMGPICVAAHLAPFLPGHPVVKIGGPQSIPAVSAAPFGSASILTISWAYIRLMGGQNLKRATEVAILNANYIKARLEPHYPILYQGENGTVAHELIVDCRAFKQSSGVEVEDIAKRLMDYGFHAPTVSFPVPGTLMIEPTESEPKAELDRFIDALISIRAEIAAVEKGTADRADNVLKMAPHTAEESAADAWTHPYTREQAAFPLPWVRAHKFWPSVGRLNNAYGDKNLYCSCPPIESYEA
ncbi:MAG: gcvP [Fibrobacteria bacterium]|jgi:glycine dehydrogenase|nr:gcvP [Fibrobacteria bacterium]